MDTKMADSAQSAGKVVRETIERDGVVRHGLARGLINHRALARSIQASTPTAMSFDAILSAIRRYPVEESASRREAIGAFIQKLSLRNGITVISIRNQKEKQKTIARFTEEVGHAAGETLRVVTSVEAVSVTMDSRNASKFESRIPDSAILRKLTNLAELYVDFPLDIADTPGVVATIATELVMNDVNITQLSTMGPGRIIILVKGRDATNAYQALEGMTSSPKNSRSNHPQPKVR